eukprot:1137245-Pelagomonas_calceolata.AAC.4
MQVHGTAVFCQRPHDREEVGCGAVMTAQRIGAGKKVQMGVYRCRSAAAMAAKHRVQNTMCKHGVQDMGAQSAGIPGCKGENSALPRHPLDCHHSPHLTLAASLGQHLFRSLSPLAASQAARAARFLPQCSPNHTLAASWSRVLDFIAPISRSNDTDNETPDSKASHRSFNHALAASRSKVLGLTTRSNDTDNETSESKASHRSPNHTLAASRSRVLDLIGLLTRLNDTDNETPDSKASHRSPNHALAASRSRVRTFEWTYLSHPAYSTCAGRCLGRKQAKSPEVDNSLISLDMLFPGTLSQA